MLKVQYRMHAKIREFPSNTFYNGMLDDGSEIAKREHRAEFQKFAVLAKNFSRTTFFDLIYSAESQEEWSTSKSNMSEVNLTIQLIEKYLMPLDVSIGVVTPYKAH